MSAFTSVYKREIKSYFATPVAYVFLVIFLFFSGFLTFQEGFFAQRQASMRLFFQNMPLLFLFLVPAIAMRLWAEERRSNSIELLFTLPVTTPQAVLGKFLAAWTVLAIALALTFPMVITVAYLGDPDWGPIATGYFGSLLLAGAYLAIGSFFSAVSRNQVVAFILAVVACGVFYSAGNMRAAAAEIADRHRVRGQGLLGGPGGGGRGAVVPVAVRVDPAWDPRAPRPRLLRSPRGGLALGQHDGS